MNENFPSRYSGLAEEYFDPQSPQAAGARTVLESAPYLLASIAVHVCLFALLAFICIGGNYTVAGVDLVCTLENTPTPTPVHPVIPLDLGNGPKGKGSEPELEETGALDEETVEEDVYGDPKSPTDQPLSDQFLGALGLGAGSPSGAYSQRKGRRAKSKGGSVLCEGAVDSGLKWLVEVQEVAGNWDSAAWGGDRSLDVGVTGLALLSLTGAGHTEKSGRYRRAVQRAVTWLTARQGTRGCFAPEGTMYDHAIPLLAMLELAVMCPTPRVKKSTEMGLAYMFAVQNRGKAWRYLPRDGDNDVSVSAWCVMAMKAAEIAGIEVPESAWAGVRSFLEEATEPDTGEVGYIFRPTSGRRDEPQQKYSMTACGLLMQLFMGEDRDSATIRKGADILLANLPDWNQPGINSPFYYYWFYGSLVLFQMQGDAWKKWNGRMRDLLVQHQITAKGAMMGSWDPETQHHFGRAGGRVVSTAFAVLTLETYYRYEIMFK